MTKVMKSLVCVFVLSCIVFSVPAGAVVIKPDNIVLPGSAGETFSFDLTVHDPCGVTGTSFNFWVNVSGPGTLTFDEAASEAVANNTTGDPDYWIYGNSGGANARDWGSNNYEFGDDPQDTTSLEPLVAGDIMARYAFSWDGTEGDYTFSFDLANTTNNFIADMWIAEALEFIPGDQAGGSDFFTVAIPEPVTMLLFGLGGAVLVRKRRA